MWDAFVNAIQTAFAWLMNLLLVPAHWVVGLLLSILPDNFSSSGGGALSTVSAHVAAANQWVPLDLGLSLFILYLTFILGAYAVKVTRQVIP